MVYLARKGDRRTWRELGTDSFTAISRPPYFTALALWPCAGYEGGGRFVDDREVRLAIGSFRVADVAPSSELPVRVTSYGEWHPSEWRLRDWHPLDCDASILQYNGWKLATRYEKTSRCGRYRLVRSSRKVKMPRQVPRIVDRFCLISNNREQVIGEADFVDFDQRGRLIKGLGGQILASNIPDGLPLK